MFAYLKGTLTLKAPTQIVVDVGGVGYEISIPLSTFSALPEKGQPVMIVTHVHIREDAHQIFGFFTEDEKSLFRLLLTVSGIGPKMALTVLSGVPLTDLKRAIIHEDLALLTSISGIGRKTAERIIIELREKVLLEDKSSQRKQTDGGGQEEIFFQDTVLALVSLGYKKQDAQDAVRKTITSSKGKVLTVDELLRAALKSI